MVIAAGTLRFNFIKFIIADGFAACVSGGMFIALGYWGRRKMGDLHHIERQIEHYQRFVLSGLLVVLLVFVLWKFLKNRKPPVNPTAVVERTATSTTPPERSGADVPV